MIGKIPGYPGDVWYNPKGIANILSMANVKKCYQITYDSSQGDGFIVHKTNGTQRCFMESDKGLFYLDRSEQPKATVLVTTVEDVKSNFTVRDYRQAELTRHSQNVIGRPSTRDFAKIVESNLLPNCPVSVRDIMIADNIFGPNIGSLKGKTVRRKGEQVPTQRCEVPIHIIQRHRDVTLCIHVMFVNKTLFILSGFAHQI